MKKIIWIFWLLFFSQLASAQDVFVKTQPAFQDASERQQIVLLKDGGFVSAGQTSSINSPAYVYVRKYNPCGNTDWTLTLRDSSLELNLVQLNLDSANNIVISGMIDSWNQNPQIFVAKISPNGGVSFFKQIRSNLNYNNLLYSASIAPNGDYILYGLHRYTSSPPNNQKIAAIRIKPDGNGSMRWAKSYDFQARSWGRMTATSDNGFIARTSNSIVKVDSMGQIQWANQFNMISSTIGRPIETDSGYVFVTSWVAAIDRSIVYSFRKDGSLHFGTNRFMNHFARASTLASDTSILLSGINPFNGNSLSLLEIDSRNGQIIQLRESAPGSNLNGIQLTGIQKNNRGDFLGVGPDNRGLIRQDAIIKWNDSLTSLSCSLVDYAPIFDQSNFSLVGPITHSSQDLNDLSLNNRFLLSSKSGPEAGFTECGLTIPRGNIDLGPDTLLCLKQFVVLGDRNSDYDSYLWSDSSTSKTLFVNQAGSYWLQVVAACDTLRDTVQIDYYPEIGLNLGADTSVCFGSSVILKSPIVLDNYLWSTGGTSNQISVNQPGVYWLETSTKCGPVRDSIEVIWLDQPDQPSLGPDTVICDGNSLALNAGTAGNFLWSTGSTNQQIVAADSGWYWLEVVNSCGAVRDSIHLGFHPTFRLSYALSMDTVFVDEKIKLKNTSQNRSRSYWNLGDGSFIERDSLEYAYRYSGLFQILLRSIDLTNCVQELEIPVWVIAKPVRIPNVLTPNGDGINDQFGPLGDDIQSYSIRIFNLWGNSVFQAKNTPWSGYNNDGTSLSQGVYSYLIELEMQNKKNLHFQGSVYLTR